MPTPSEVREIASERGLAKKRKNAIVALLSGALPGVVLSYYLLVSWERWLIGLVIGLIRQQWSLGDRGRPAAGARAYAGYLRGLDGLSDSR